MEQQIERATMIAHALDNQFSIFGFRFGLNALLELIPEIGDIIAIGLSLYLIRLGLQLGLPKIRIAEMMLNLGITFIAGLVPFFGDAFYLSYKPNMRNLRILQSTTEKSLRNGSKKLENA